LAEHDDKEANQPPARKSRCTVYSALYQLFSIT